ncbi:unnamed protein product [Coregonus sp. 'balchen']|nr:unnamed protein product [Coregonus sp. 'balchen']
MANLHSLQHPKHTTRAYTLCGCHIQKLGLFCVSHSFCSVKKAATQREQLRTPLTALLDKIAVVDKTKPSWEKMASQIGAQAQKTEGGRAEEE